MATTLREQSLQRAESGRLVATAINDAIIAELPCDLDLLSTLAHRIKQCNADSNLWLASDLHNKHGEAFDGSGRFWNCGSKLCQDCLSKTSRRNRKILSNIVENQKLLVNEHWRFMTLTMPNLGLKLLEARQIINYAWTLFRKKDWFKRNFVGGCKSEEFTLTKNGYHYHIHCIVRSRYIEYSSMRHYWTEALRVAFTRCGHELSLATSDHMAIANIRKIGSLSEAIKEVAKYITKQSSWRKLKAEDLLDIARIERWPRMFEFFGSFRNLNGVAVLEDDLDPLNKTILDTKELSDGDPDIGWRKMVRAIGVARYLDALHQQISDQSEFRIKQLKFHYQVASFWRIKAPNPPDIYGTIDQVRRLETKRDGAEFAPQRIRQNKQGGWIEVETGRIVNYKLNSFQNAKIH